MKIVVVNYRYFVSGGPERYMFNIMDLLKKEGHQVIPFSIAHPRNAQTPYAHYFLSAIGKGDEVYFADMEQKLGIKDKLKGLSRMIYSPEAKRRFRNLLVQEKPDLVYILYYQNKISCSIVDAAWEMGIPVVQRISDYSLLAPCSHLFDSSTNTICELCLTQGPSAAIKHRCVMGSKVYSAVKALAIKTQNARKMPLKISRFIFPSSFTLQKFADAGYDPRKLVHIPTLFNDRILNDGLPISYEPFALFVGRLDPDKGLMTLLDAFADTDMPLKIIGFSSEPGYEQKLRDHIAPRKHRIEFLGAMDFSQLQTYLSRCLFTVVPSEWYDNLPNTVLESFAMAKCVVATNVGSLAENISHSHTGLLFDYKDSAALRENARWLFANPAEAQKMGRQARYMVDEKYCGSKHLNSLLNVFNQAIDESKAAKCCCS